MSSFIDSENSSKVSESITFEAESTPAFLPLREQEDLSLQNALDKKLNSNRKLKSLIAKKKIGVGLVDLKDPNNIPTEYECYQLLLNGKDERIKVAVLYLLGQLKKDQFHDLIVAHMDSANGKIRDFAKRALEA